MNVNKNLTGAGFVIYFDNTLGLLKDKPREILYLCLLGLNDKLDFPKGTIDYGEYPFDCAVRETFEETNLKNGVHYFGDENLYREFNDRLVMYITKLSSVDFIDSIKILPNEKLGIVEHKSYHWCSYDQCKEGLLNYLKPVIEWCNTEIIQLEKI